MKILLVTAFFYPQNVIAVSRVGQWAKYLSRFGHDVTVLTTKKYPFWPLDYKVDLPSNVKIIEIDYLPFIFKKILGLYNSSKLNNESGKNTISVRRGLLGYIKSKILRYFDPHDLWIIPASKFGIELVKRNKFDIIVSSYSPSAAHHVAKNIKNKNSGLIWVADFRDLWARNHMNSRGSLALFLERIREKICIKHSDILITVSKPLADVLQECYPEKRVEIIPNGYDPEDYQDIHVRDFNENINFPQVIITYTGMIYEGKRDPSPLLIAINDLIDSGAIQKNSFLVNFYGPSRNILNKIIISGNFNRHNFINVFDQISRKQSIDIQKNSDILLLLEWFDETSRGVLTGKLFEYLVSGRPILGVGVHPESEAGLLITRARAGLLSSNVNDIKELLIRYKETRKFHSFEPDIEEIKKYSRDQQVLSLIGMLKESSDD